MAISVLGSLSNSNTTKDSCYPPGGFLRWTGDVWVVDYGPWKPNVIYTGGIYTTKNSTGYVCLYKNSNCDPEIHGLIWAKVK